MPTSTVTTELQRNHHSALRHELGDHERALVLASSSLQKRNVHQVEEVEQSDPGDAGHKVDPAQQDQHGFGRLPGKSICGGVNNAIRQLQS